MSRSIITYSAPSALLADTPQFPRRAGYMRRLRCAGWCRPRPPASSSELSLPFLLSMSPSTPPESPPTARTQSSSAGFAFVHPSLDSALSTPHFNPLHVESTFGVSWFADSLQPTELLASLGGPDQAFYSAQPTEAFTSELSAESVALLAVGYIYGGIWAPPPTGLSPVGTAASFAARGR